MTSSLNINKFVKIPIPHLAIEFETNPDSYTGYKKFINVLTSHRRFASKEEFLAKVKLFIDWRIDSFIGDSKHWVMYLEKPLEYELAGQIINHLHISRPKIFHSLEWQEIMYIPLIHTVLSTGIDPSFIDWKFIYPLSKVRELKYYSKYMIEHISCNRENPLLTVRSAIMGLDPNHTKGSKTPDYYNFMHLEDVQDVYRYNEKIIAIWNLSVLYHDPSISIWVKKILERGWFLNIYDSTDSMGNTRPLSLLIRDQVIANRTSYFLFDPILYNAIYSREVLYKDMSCEQLDKYIKEDQDFDVKKYTLWKQIIVALGKGA